MGCNKEKKSDLCVKQDIFTLLRTGHFHFALTGVVLGCSAKVVMLHLAKVEMLHSNQRSVHKNGQRGATNESTGVGPHQGNSSSNGKGNYPGAGRQAIRFMPRSDQPDMSEDKKGRRSSNHSWSAGPTIKPSASCWLSR